MKVLVAIDNSPSSETILKAVVNRSWSARTTFCVLNVVNLQRFERLPALIEDATMDTAATASYGLTTRLRVISNSRYRELTLLGTKQFEIDASQWKRKEQGRVALQRVQTF